MYTIVNLAHLSTKKYATEKEAVEQAKKLVEVRKLDGVDVTYTVVEIIQDVKGEKDGR